MSNPEKPGRYLVLREEIDGHHGFAATAWWDIAFYAVDGKWYGDRQPIEPVEWRELPEVK